MRPRWRAPLARPFAWVLLLAAIVGVEYLAGPNLTAGVLYLLPIVLVAWYGPLRVVVALSLLAPATRPAFFALELWDPSAQPEHTVVNTALRIGALLLVGLLVHRARQARDLEREIAALRGLLPICMYCKHIQDGDGNWQAVEQYIAARTDAAFTHRVCPRCEDGHHTAFLG